MKRDNEEQNVSIAETISAMQENLLTDSLSFAKIVQVASSVVEKTKIKLHKQKFEVGDIVYLNPQVEFVNWRLKKWLDRPFVITQIPVDTQKFKTYTLRLLDDPNNEDCWEDLAFHESFLQKKD